MSEHYDCTDPEERERGLQAAAGALREGGLVVMPTDTVYGIAADAFTKSAVADLLAAKGRGRDKPPPVLIGSQATLDGVAYNIPETARDLVTEFWPGGLTLVCREQGSLSWDLGDSKGTVAVRMPNNEVALDLLMRTGPLAVSSANRTGELPATTVQEAADQLGESVRVYLDGGATPGPKPSSIVDVTGSAPRLLRAGVIPLERLQDVAPDLTDSWEVFAPPEPEPEVKPWWADADTGGGSPDGSAGDVAELRAELAELRGQLVALAPQVRALRRDLARARGEDPPADAIEPPPEPEPELVPEPEPVAGTPDEPAAAIAPPPEPAEPEPAEPAAEFAEVPAEQPVDAAGGLAADGVGTGAGEPVPEPVPVAGTPGEPAEPEPSEPAAELADAADERGTDAVEAGAEEPVPEPEPAVAAAPPAEGPRPVAATDGVAPGADGER